MKLLGNLTIWPTVLDLCLFGRVISAIAFRSLFSSKRLSKRTELHWNSSQACFLNHTFTFYAIGQLDKNCMWKRKRLKTSLTSSKIKLPILFHWQPNQNLPQIWSFAVNRFEVIKNTFQFNCDLLCVKRCFIHLEVLLDWIIPHQVRR